MTNKAIYDNLKRLLIFLDVYKEEKISKFNNDDIIKPIKLLHEYSRYLDFYNYPKLDGLSYLILDGDDFEEIKKVIAVQYPPSNEITPDFLYQLYFDGYLFTINNKDIKGYLSISVTIIQAEQKDHTTILYFSKEDHFDMGRLSPANSIKKIQVYSTGEIANVIEYNTNTPYKHFIIIDKVIYIKEGETITDLNKQTVTV
ncbi:MAG: hypothetical protein IPJ81_06880 [Chitinophagaceae bacterium]|nr:hypothetical protein [Chitinophagaceae bacterium]